MVYEYLVEAQPCGCRMVTTEDDYSFETLKQVGTGLSCGHGNTYEPIEVVDPDNWPTNLNGQCPQHV